MSTKVWDKSKLSQLIRKRIGYHWQGQGIDDQGGENIETGRAEADRSWRVGTSPPGSSLRIVQGCAQHKGAMAEWALFSLQIIIPSTKIFWKMKVKGFGGRGTSPFPNSHNGADWARGSPGPNSDFGSKVMMDQRKVLPREPRGKLSSRIKHRWSWDMAGTGHLCLPLSTLVIPDNHLNVQIQGKWSSMNHLPQPSPKPLLPFKRNHTLKDIVRASEKSFMFMP